MKIVSIFKALGSLLLHLVAFAVIGASFLPIAKWYYFYRPILGVDFFNTVSHVRPLLEEFVLSPWGYQTSWFGGYPMWLNLSLFWFYPITFVAWFLPILAAVKVSMLGSFFLLLVFVYLAAYRLSRQHVLAIAVSVLVAFSANMYGSLTWGGSLPYFATQMFFPLTLWLLASYLQSGKMGWYWAAVLATGLAFLGHGVVAGSFVIPSGVLLLLLGWRQKPERFSRRVGEVALLVAGMAGVSLRISPGILMGVAEGFLKGRLLSPLGRSVARVQFSEGGIATVGDPGQVAFERSRFAVLFSDTNSWFYAVLGFSLAVLLVALVADRRKRTFFRVLPWGLLALYSVGHVFLNAYGIPFLPQAWYRAFWHFPITLGLFVAALVGYFQEAFASVAKTAGRIFSVVAGAGAAALLVFVYAGNEAGKTIAVVEAKTSPSSAYPEAINLVRDDQELSALLPRLTPSWLDSSERNFRIYESDAQVNVWWSGLFAMPMARGYIDPPIGTDRMGHIFLLDQAVGNDGLVTNFNYPVETAKNMALYYLDWSAIRYFEGGHVSISDNKPPSSYLQGEIAERGQAETVGLWRLYETKSGKPEIMDIPQYLEYYRFSDEVTSPILSVSNAASLLCLCDWPAYESLTKVLAMNNIHSRKLVTAFSEEPVDGLSGEELARFDVVVLANYRYRNRERALSLLLDYVAGGGKVFIDTGGETRDSQASGLSSFFPFSETVREGLGSEWALDAASDPVFAGVDLAQFSPPTWEDAEWKFSYPVSEVDEEAEILLRQNGEPVLIRWSIGEGVALWSGMNLTYHVHANTNVVESELVVRLLESLTPLELREVNEGEVKFVGNRSARIRSKGGRGVLFKEQFYPGWRVTVDGRPARVYVAGPAYPGYLYVPLNNEGEFGARFEYRGHWWWSVIWFSALFWSLTLIDLAIFGGRLVGQRIIRFGEKVRKRVGGWWEKEE